MSSNGYPIGAVSSSEHEPSSHSSKDELDREKNLKANNDHEDNSDSSQIDQGLSSPKSRKSNQSFEETQVTIALSWMDLCYDVIEKGAKGRKASQNGGLSTSSERTNGVNHHDEDHDSTEGETSRDIETGQLNAVDEGKKKEGVNFTDEPLSKGQKTKKHRFKKFRRSRHSYKRILDHVDGCISPGEMVAILGPSGSGKTTLLNILAGRISQGIVSGSILANGSKRTRAYYANIAYVEQDDLMFSTLTVFETLVIAALLRLPREMPKENKLKRVNNLIQEFGLAQCKNTYIGGPEIRGISGGERKRTAIAVELIRNPCMLFLDEPTSGLDSSTAYNIVESLKNLAGCRRTVLMTIHQPKANIFALFDKAIFLSQGEVIFFGPINEVVPYFSSINFPCPQYDNPADHYMDVITIDPRSLEAQQKSQKRIETLSENYVTQKQPENLNKINRVNEYSKKESTLETVKTHKYQATYWKELNILGGRAWKNFIRNKRLSIYAFIQTIFLALLIGGVFFGVNNGPTGVQNRVGAIFFIILNQTFSTLFPVLNVFPSEITVFKRERASRMYRVSTYYLSRNIADLPVQFILPIIFSSIVYWMIGFRATAGAFFTFIAFTIIIVFASQSLGLAISAASPNITVANIIAPLIVIVFALFGGFYSNTQSFWGGISWIQYISFINYAFKGLMQNEFKGLVFCPNDPQACTFTTGAQVIAFYQAGTPPVWVNFVVIFGFGILFKFLGFIFLWIRARPARQIT
jgi:ABC-type multidrug transport system ATPase subunit